MPAPTPSVKHLDLYQYIIRGQELQALLHDWNNQHQNCFQVTEIINSAYGNPQLLMGATTPRTGVTTKDVSHITLLPTLHLSEV